MKNKLGGKRPGAGRKPKWKEPMTRVYIPVRLVERYKKWLKKALAAPLLGEK